MMFLWLWRINHALLLFQLKDEACPPNCPCDQPQNWRSQNISLKGLEVVEIKNFKGCGHEVDFLKLLFRCAPLTKVTVKLAPNVIPDSRGCKVKDVIKVFWANPSADCHVYNKRGIEVCGFHSKKKVIYRSASTRCNRI